jgi:outer membrane lipoprotein SlyB
MLKTITKAAAAAALVGAALMQSACASEDYDHDGGGGYYASDSGPYADDPHYASYRYYAEQCGREKHNRNVAGTVAGAVVGGLLGNAVTHGGGRVGGTVLGAAAGAAVGSNIARSTVNCKNGRPYWRRDDTVDYDSYAGYPGSHDPDWYRGHDCRWVRNSDEDYIRVCRGPDGYYYPSY